MAHIIKNPMTIQDGKIILRSGPGLGIEIDENKVEKYKI